VLLRRGDEVCVFPCIGGKESDRRYSYLPVGRTGRLFRRGARWEEEDGAVGSFAGKNEEIFSPISISRRGRRGKSTFVKFHSRSREEEEGSWALRRRLLERKLTSHPVLRRGKSTAPSCSSGGEKGERLILVVEEREKKGRHYSNEFEEKERKSLKLIERSLGGGETWGSRSKGSNVTKGGGETWTFRRDD